MKRLKHHLLLDVTIYLVLAARTMAAANRPALKPITESTATLLHGIVAGIIALMAGIILAMEAEVLVTVEMVGDRVVILAHHQLFQHLEWESVLKM